MFPFIPNWIHWGNIISDQLLLQLMRKVHQQLHHIPCNWYHCCFLSFPIELKEIISFLINCFPSQLMKCINCILFHVIDTISNSFHSQLNWMRKFHSRSIARPPIDEVHQLHPIPPCNWYHSFLSFPIEFIEIISFQNNCSSNWWGSTPNASYSM